MIGASGLVGGILLNKLLKNNNYSKVTILSRRILEIKDPNLEQVIVNFDAIEKYEDVIKADDIFSTMGTTTGSAGSKEMYSKIEFDYVYNTAKIALKNGASRFITVSSAGANINSLFFYTKIKGKIEDAISRLGFDAVYIFRPSFILGDRKEHRTGEKAMMFIVKLISPLLVGPLRKWRGIEANAIAEIMVRSALQNRTGVHILESDKIQQTYNNIIK